MLPINKEDLVEPTTHQALHHLAPTPEACSPRKALRQQKGTTATHTLIKISTNFPCIANITTHCQARMYFNTTASPAHVSAKTTSFSLSSTASTACHSAKIYTLHLQEKISTVPAPIDPFPGIPARDPVCSTLVPVSSPSQDYATVSHVRLSLGPPAFLRSCPSSSVPLSVPGLLRLFTSNTFPF
ncbi:hypothetical protein DPEC_G00343680 [Dallia pectoralis]|uniref:Uncharacterized protein n=1 Tax=Dallia pectoralis TaxID=75939 RepID=A0ACC2F2X2_DALPE|nr:hypothetical protein DPEC_G00343680 [Dallia pectoralis]